MLSDGDVMLQPKLRISGIAMLGPAKDIAILSKNRHLCLGLGVPQITDSVKGEKESDPVSRDVITGNSFIETSRKLSPNHVGFCLRCLKA